MKTVLFGLDGATYTVLDHLMSLGLMPNLAELCRRGSRAVLESTPIPITPMAWTTLATGRSAGHHGLHDFVRPEKGTKEAIFFRVNDSREIHCETIWKYASRHGKRVTVLNYFGMAPPQPLNGHSMPGFTSGRHLRRASYPADLFSRLQAVDGFDVNVLGLDIQFEQQVLQDFPADQWLPWIRHHVEREKTWFGVMEHLMTHEPSDLTAIVFDGVDKIQHLAYRYLDPALIPAQPNAWEREVIDLCRRYFQQIDEFLGRTLARVGRWGRVFVASDHGFTASTEILYVNKWLHDQGLLRWRGDVQEDEEGANLKRTMTAVAEVIDLANTRAFALSPSCNGIYLSVPESEYEGFRNDLCRRLLQIRGLDGGPIITDVKKREEWFPGPFMTRLPDLILTLRNYGFISVLNARAPVIPRKQPTGTHHPHGVLLGTGPGIREGADAGMYNLLDMAPLLLHSLGLEIPAEMEGRFPTALYESAYLDSDPVRWGKAAGTPAPAPEPVAPADGAEMDESDQAVIFERLKSLGYIE